MFRQFAAEENLEMTIGKGKRPRDSPSFRSGLWINLTG